MKFYVYNNLHSKNTKKINPFKYAKQVWNNNPEYKKIYDTIVIEMPFEPKQVNLYNRNKNYVEGKNWHLYFNRNKDIQRHWYEFMKPEEREEWDHNPLVYAAYDYYNKPVEGRYIVISDLIHYTEENQPVINLKQIIVYDENNKQIIIDNDNFLLSTVYKTENL